jgi:iron complex transport system permease protein
LKRGIWVLALLLAVLIASAWIALGIGPSETSWSDVPRLVTGEADSTTREILTRVRMPRVVLAALVGAALSGAGVVFQAVLRNPLADPYILGISGGAALGAVLFTTLISSSALGSALGRPSVAFAGALATLFLLSLARVRGRTEPTVLLLVGVVLNAFFSAVILYLLTAGDASRFRGALFYLVGSMSAASSLSWTVLLSVGAFILAGLAVLALLSHRLNLLAFGEEVAEHLGVDVERTIWSSVTWASLITAAAVAFTGLVGFVGLIVPHLVRTLAGPDHRLLLPASALGGAAFLVLADTAARTLVAPAEMPVGVITALVGGPFFLFLFLRRLRER